MSSEAGEFVAGDIVTLGGYAWRVLNVLNDKALLISEYVLEERPYHNRDEYTTWAWCDLRRYLNGEFYEKLPEELKSIILETKVSNHVNPLWKTTGGSETKDRVFLLSIREAFRYFGDDTAVLKEKVEKITRGEVHFDDDGVLCCYYCVSIHSDFDNVRIAHNLQGEKSEWWLRSPGEDSYRAAYIGENGWDNNGYGSVITWGDPAHNYKKGVRPVVRVRIEGLLTQPPQLPYTAS